MFCRKCGSEIPDDSVFCLKCGVKVEFVENKLQENVVEETVVIKEQHMPVDEVVSSGDKDEVPDSSADKKITYSILGICAVLFFIVIISMVVSENAKKCTFGNCTEYKMEGSDYCKEHTCKEDGCTSPKSKYNSYCYTHEEEHACASSGCENYKWGDGEYCYEHTCNESGCTNQKGLNSDYCTDHQVDMRKKLGNEFSFSVNSAGGIKLRFRAQNKSGKEIKYIRFDVELRNAVGDKIKDEITNEYSVSVEIVGPIANWEAADFEDIIGYNDNCARIDIMEVTLVYTDGTSQTGHYGWYTKN